MSPDESAARMTTDETSSTRGRVAVIGGGPAGCTAAALLAQEGHQVVLFEKERFPRFHIGESLMTETWWIFEKLGVLDRMRESAFPRKHSVQFISAQGKPSRPFYFSDTNPHESAVTWQVDRAEFDAMMLENARAQGVEVRQETGVDEVLFRDGRASGVRFTGPDGKPGELESDVVLDASGLRALLARQLRLIEPDPKLRKAAIFSHWEGAHRDPGIDEGATLIISTRENTGWFWYIPLSHDRVSVGVVGATADLLKGRGQPEEVIEEEIAANPTMQCRLHGARRVAPVRVINDYSYRSSRIAGDGWVLLGDAFGFIDPVYSTGVFLALKSGEMAARTVHDAILAGDLSAARLGTFGPEFNEGMEAMRKLVFAFYSPGFSFADFVRQHPEHAPRLVDLLTGNVFKPGVTDIFEDMKEFCELPETRPLAATGPTPA